MYCTKCKDSYPMGFQNCPTCGASVEFALINTPEPDESSEEVNRTEEAVPSQSYVPEMKISSLTDEEMFYEQFVIPSSRPPEDPEPPKPEKKRSLFKSKKKRVEEEPVDLETTSVENTEVVSEEYTEPIVPIDEPIVPIDESEVSPKPEVEEVFFAKNLSFVSAASEAALGLRPDALKENTDTAKGEETVEAVAEYSSEVPETSEKPESVKKKPKRAPKKPAKAVEEKPDPVPDEMPKVVEIKPEETTGGQEKHIPVGTDRSAEKRLPEKVKVVTETVKKAEKVEVTEDVTENRVKEAKPETKENHFRDTAKKVASEKKTTKSVGKKTEVKKPSRKKVPRELILASVFGLISVFIPLMFIPSNMYLNRIPQKEKSSIQTVIKSVLNILFFVNLFCLVIGIISLTKTLALNHEAIFGGNMSLLTGEASKIVPLMFYRGIGFWSNLFSPESTSSIPYFFNTYLTEFNTNVNELKTNFSVKALLSVFEKVGIPILFVLGAVGVTGKIAFDSKISGYERQLERTYEMGNFRGEEVRAIKEKKRNLTFKKGTFIKIVVFLFILTLVLSKGYILIEKLIPLWDSLKEDINKK